jgi:prolipoprotein diacylglyceryltransferase
MRRIVIYAFIAVFLAAVVVFAFLYPLVRAHSVEESNSISCVVQYYAVYSVARITNENTTSFGTSTLSSNTCFTTITSVRETVGYVTTTTENNYTGTLTGALAEWTVSSCRYTTAP